jgi:hypothetical protein
MAYNNLQILNFSHNIVSLSNGNTLVITDNIKGNSISIPEPITHILQINSPGPQGPAGPSGSQGPSGSGGGGNIDTGSFATTGSNTFRGNQTITGSIIFNSGSQITSTYYGNNYPGYIDIIAGAPGGFVELLSYNQSSSFVVEDYGVYITTNSSSLFNLWEFRNDGRLLAPRGIEAPSFTGSLQSTSVKISGSLTITGSSTTNINSGAFTVTSPSAGSLLYATSSGYIRLGDGDDYIVDFSIGTGQMRIINGNQITMYAPVITLGYPGNSLIVNITGSLNVSEGITGSFSGDGSGSFTGSFNGLLTEYVLTTNLGDPGPSTPPYLIDLIITQGGTYIISRVDTTVLGYIYFPDPVLCLGQRITIQNRDNTDSADIYDNGYLPRDITNSAIDRILSQTTKTFIAAERSPSGQINWLEL